MTAGTEPSGTPPWAGLSALAAEAADAPAVKANRTVRDDAEPIEEPAIEPVAVSARLRGKSRKALIGGLALSLVLHAAALAFFLDQLNPSGLEAETEEAVSVEIVADAPPQSGMAAADSGDAEPVSGDAETSNEQADADSKKQVEDPSPEQTAEVDPVEDQRAPEPDFMPPPPDPTLLEMLTEPPAVEVQPDFTPLPPEPDQLQALAQPPTIAVEPDVTVPAPEIARMEALAAPPAIPSEPELILPPVADVPLPSPRPKIAEAPRPREKAERTAAQRAEEKPEKTRKTRRSKTEAAPSRTAKADAVETGKQQTKSSRKTVSAAGAAGALGGASAGAEARYARTLNSHIQRHKRYPEAAARQRITGVTRLAITIDRAGRLSAVRVAGGSGHSILDQEALAVARRAAPYPPPPEGIGKGTFAFMVSLRFKP